MNQHEPPRSTLQTWWRAAVALKPYGPSLLSPSASLWIGFARLIIAAMALVEGASWGYVGGLLGDDPLSSWTYGLALGAIILLFVWAVDVSLMSLDVSSHRSAKGPATAAETAVTGETDAPDPHALTAPSVADQRTLVDHLRWPIFPVGIRSALVVISVLVTAPFISMYVLRLDIDKELDDRFQSAIVQVRATKQSQVQAQEEERRKVLDRDSAEVRTKYEAWTRARTAYAKEVAGTGESGAYGEGAAARAAAKVAEEAKLDYERAQGRLTTQRDDKSPVPASNELKALDAAIKAKDFNTLKRSFGIAEVPNSFLARNAVLKSFEGKPEFKRIEYSVFSLLGFLVTALFLLKYFEPKSVRIYFSEVRQSEWQEYANGVYDGLLADVSKSTSAAARGMSAIHFCKLWDEVIAPAINDRAYTEAMAHVERVRSSSKAKLDLYSAIAKRVSDLRSEMAQVSKGADRASEEHAAAISKIDGIRRNSSHLIRSFDPTSSDSLSSDFNQRLDQLNDVVQNAEAKAQSCSDQLADAKVKLSRLQADLSQSERELAGLNQELAPVLALLRETQEKQIEVARASLGRVRPKA